MTKKALVWLGTVVAMISACDPDAAFRDEDVAEIEAGIINGVSVSSSQNTGVVALYHQMLCESGNAGCSPVGAFYWFPRPCSATVLRTTSTNAWLLTARHCVTDTGYSGGNVVSTSRLRVHTSVSPGLAAPNPPSGSFAVDAVVAVPPVLGGAHDTGRDLAMVRFVASLSTPTVRTHLPVLAPPIGTALLAFGYGRAVEGEPSGNIENGTSGAGTLRYASGFAITSSCFGCFSYSNLTPEGRAVWRGDSGGPSLAVTTEPFLALFGVHSTASLFDSATDTSVSDYMPWIGSQLGYLHLSSKATPTFNLGVEGGVPQNGARVIVQSTRDAVATRWIWDPINRYITIRDSAGARYFLTVNGIDLTLYLTPFGTLPASRQKWTLDGRIMSDTTGIGGALLCLHEGTDQRVGLASCSSTNTRQRWYWHPHP